MVVVGVVFGFFATHSNEVDNKCERAGPPHPQSVTKLIVWSRVICLLVPTVVEVDDFQCQSMNWKCAGLNQAVLTKPANVDGIIPPPPPPPRIFRAFRTLLLWADLVVLYFPFSQYHFQCCQQESSSGSSADHCTPLSFHWV